jgi:hypothetical protein
MEGMEALAFVLSFTLGDLVGPDQCQCSIAQRQTAAILRKWTTQDTKFADWNHPGYSEHSQGGAFSLTTEIFYPIMTAWLDKVWRYTNRQGGKPLTLVQLTLYDQLRSSSEDFAQMATFVKKISATKGLPNSQQGGGAQGGGAKKARPTCSHCALRQERACGSGMPHRTP